MLTRMKESRVVWFIIGCIVGKKLPKSVWDWIGSTIMQAPATIWNYLTNVIATQGSGVIVGIVSAVIVVLILAKIGKK